MLHHWVLQHGKGRNIGYSALAVLATFVAFAPLILWFQDHTAGYMPFDNQFPLTPAMIGEQLTLYTEQSRVYYAWFFAVDMIFPPLFSLFFALLWAWLLRNAPASQPILAAGLLWLPFLSALFDWTENLANLWIIYAAAPTAVWTLAIGLKYAKFCAVMMNIGVSVWLAIRPD